MVDPDTGHLMWIADAYVKSSLFPESYQQSDGTSYMRNAVKAVIDAKTCAITLYAVNMNEPITAAWNAIYPGLLTPLSDMSTYLRSHLRYPEDLFNDSGAGATRRCTSHSPSVFYQGADLFNIAQQSLNGTNQATTAYYVEATLPGTSSPQFVLLQTFSPGANGGGNTANNMTAWLAAECDYIGTTSPKLVSVRLNNADNVLGPLQFDNNINTNPADQLGDQPARSARFDGHARQRDHPAVQQRLVPLRPAALRDRGGQRRHRVPPAAGGDRRHQATASPRARRSPPQLQALLNTTQPIPGLQQRRTGRTTPTPSPSPSPSASPSPGVTPTPTHHSDRHAAAADHRAGQQDHRRQLGRGGGAHGRQLHRLRRRRGQGAAGPAGAPEVARPAVAVPDAVAGSPSRP